MPLDIKTDDGGFLHFALKHHFDEENQVAHIWLKLTGFETRIGRWHVIGVSAPYERIVWHYAGYVITMPALCFQLPPAVTLSTCVVLRPDALDCSMTQRMRAINALRRRFDDLRQWISNHVLDGGYPVSLECTLRKDPTTVHVTIGASAALSSMVDEIDAGIRGLWGETSLPTDPNDKRLIIFNQETRELIAFINAGGRPAGFVKQRGGSSNDVNNVNQKLHRLRKDHPDLIRPASTNRRKRRRKR